MTRHFCDACGKEAGTVAFQYPNHIGNGDPGRCYAFVDGTLWNSRTDSAEVCIPCYNRILGGAYREFTALKVQWGVTRCHECGEVDGHGAGCSR